MVVVVMVVVVVEVVVVIVVVVVVVVMAVLVVVVVVVVVRVVAHNTLVREVVYASLQVVKLLYIIKSKHTVSKIINSVTIYI